MVTVNVTAYATVSVNFIVEIDEEDLIDYSITDYIESNLDDYVADIELNDIDISSIDEVEDVEVE